MSFALIAVISTVAPALAIRGGVEAPAPYPFSGSLQRPDSPREDGHTCGVTLVAPRWVVTAGHCTVHNPSGAQVGHPRDWSVRLGTTDAGSGDRFRCTIDAIVPHLREEGYTQDNAYRYDPDCTPSHGGSGSPIVVGDTVVGVHSTGNDSGEQCTADNPCEVAADGTVTVHQGRRYGQQVTRRAVCESMRTLPGVASTPELLQGGGVA